MTIHRPTVDDARTEVQPSRTPARLIRSRENDQP